LRASLALRGTASPWSRPEAATLYRLIRAEGERVRRLPSPGRADVEELLRQWQQAG
jgi:hypothetical protein